MKTTRIRNEVRNILRSGDLSTTEIRDHINRKYRHGTTMHQLVNVLGKDPQIKKNGFASIDVETGRYDVVIWTYKIPATSLQLST